MSRFKEILRRNNIRNRVKKKSLSRERNIYLFLIINNIMKYHIYSIVNIRSDQKVNILCHKSTLLSF